jgi:hypothetical protein
MQKIIIDGHGGHLCEAHLNETGIFEVGETIEEAIGKLIKNHKESGFEIKILPCSTTAYEKSGVHFPGESTCQKCGAARYMQPYPCYTCGSYEDADDNFEFKQSNECRNKELHGKRTKT